MMQAMTRFVSGGGDISGAVSRLLKARRWMATHRSSTGSGRLAGRDLGYRTSLRVCGYHPCLIPFGGSGVLAWLLFPVQMLRLSLRGGL